MLFPISPHDFIHGLFPYSQGIVRHLYFNESIRDAVSAPRIHHQLIPMEIQYEPGLDATIVEALQAIGHKMVPTDDNGFAAVTAIAREGNKLTPVYDRRRLGSASVIQ